MKKAAPYIVNYLTIALISIISALSMYVFVLPNKFSMGGITGISVMIEYLTGKSTGIFIMLFNVPLLVLAFFFFNKNYVFKTLVAIAASSLALIVFPKMEFIPLYKSDNLLVAAIAGGVVGGLVLAALYKLGGSSGGSEIIGGVVQTKMPAYNIAWFVFIMDAAVVVVSVIVTTLNKDFSYMIDILIMSIVRMFISSMVCSTFLEGIKSAIKFEIITPHPQELGKELVNELKRGVTLMQGKGMYTGADKGILICVVSKKQIGTFQRILKNFPDSFAYIMNTKEVYGKGFSVKTDSTQSRAKSKKDK